ncbi:GNAT family N-acetyltransferase [Pseudomonas sp. CCC3.2]|uniref:GNAT family N-acetyltransferase n=1 Tax=unclassified Pseudomonas TaxID=196821 RepID=UPI002AB5C02C|nr:MULTISPECIES: GNAT family N-acetyltransferase [unclassified Pseudomonas]MDY7559824.1 GNAT family N-acetyltransferase [Pseudomonas sp. AB6]MEA9976581.1 GNAT family N-acetyltransferase [Pseudomonas sp. RTS4]MEB0178467.1 GNAT family N-acetyltransferase [Pseudomonas sp. CCC3.2]MEB0195853.1 GNAT family N-acetyltransferase [Pseudomonas sp. 5S4]MEB0209819.1 GNAT family N-acetyltransferase [Pseudomonas sp. AB6]
MSMITLFQMPPPEPIKDQILKMVVDYLTDISMVAIAPSNPLYSLYQYGIGFEVHLYLNAMDGSKGIPVELIVALDVEDTSKVLGFLLYLPVTDDPDACAVPYMAVCATHRRQGIARSMLQELLGRYPHAELACTAAKVPYFESMGFQVLTARGPQIVMNTRDHGTSGLLAVLDVAPIYSSLEVRQIHLYLLKQHGKKAMEEAEKKRDRHLDQMTRQATALVIERRAAVL